MKRTFKDVLTAIRRSENDVDKVLKAARLQRIESGRMSDDRFGKILESVKDILFGCAILLGVAMYIGAFILMK